jgi:hypothetical protein
MMKHAFALTVVLSFCVLVSSCATAPFKGPVDLQGTWGYTMTDTYNNTYDNGIIRFEGEKLLGSWTIKNVYDIEYDGTWQIEGASLVLAGAETWRGTVTGPNSIEGTWSRENGDTGTWTARRQ